MRALLAALLLPCACAPAPRPEAHSAEALATCQARGGTVAVAGLSVIPSCAIPYPDAGRSCSDSTQCEGLCIAAGTPVFGRAVSGQCQAAQATAFDECATEVRSGRAAFGCAREKYPR